MAAIEVLAAGVPLLSSRTGVIEQVQKNQRLLFTPSSPDSLAAALRYVLDHWDEVDFEIARSQELIRERFLIDRTAVQLNTAYERLLSQRPRQPA
jgi:glycosyltransferase involved in cell wall biosynthesis